MTQYSMATAAQFAGRELGASEWVPIDQDRIDAFAACTAIANGSMSTSSAPNVKVRSAARSRMVI